MNREIIWQTLKSSFLEVFPEYATQHVGPEMSLKDLGANSIDRAEIIMLTLSRLKLNIPLIEFATCKNIAGILDILCQYQTV